MKSLLQGQLPNVRVNGLLEHVVYSMNSYLSLRAANKLYNYILHYDGHGSFGAKSRATGDGAHGKLYHGTGMGVLQVRG